VAELGAGVAVVDEQATFSQLVSRIGNKTQDNFMIDSLCGSRGWLCRSEKLQHLGQNTRLNIFWIEFDES
jgi:hypothetical protein